MNRLIRAGNDKRRPKFEWDEACERVFQLLKELLCSFPVLTLLDFDKPFKLVTDASLAGIGCILAQTDDQNRDQVIAYYSRSLNPAERRYSTIEREMKAIRDSIKKFRHYSASGKLSNLIMRH